jgi:hypothetical protein
MAHRLQTAEPSPRDFATTIRRIEEVVQSVLGAESPLSARMRTLHRRFVSDRLQIAVLGQFKRDKSDKAAEILDAAVAEVELRGRALTKTPVFTRTAQRPVEVSTTLCR